MASYKNFDVYGGNKLQVLAVYIYLYIAEFLGGKLPGRAVMNLKKVCAFVSRAFNLSQNFWGEKGKKKTCCHISREGKIPLLRIHITARRTPVNPSSRESKFGPDLVSRRSCD